MTNFDKLIVWLKTRRKKLLFGAAAVVLVLAIFPFIQFHLTKIPSNEFGDSFGFLNSIVSSLGVFALAFTIYIQMVQLKESRKSQKEFYEMQLADSYLSGLSSLVAYFHERATADGADQHHIDTAKKFRGIYSRELHNLTIRIKPIAHKIASEMPFELEMALQTIRDDIDDFRGCKNKEMPDVRNDIAFSKQKLRLFYTAFSKSEDRYCQKAAIIIRDRLFPAYEEIDNHLVVKDVNNSIENDAYPEELKGPRSEISALIGKVNESNPSFLGL